MELVCCLLKNACMCMHLYLYMIISVCACVLMLSEQVELGGV